MDEISSNQFISLTKLLVNPEGMEECNRGFQSVVEIAPKDVNPAGMIQWI